MPALPPALRLAALVLAASVWAACDSGPAGSLYDPDATGGPAPVITAVAPQGVVLAGIDEITISGQNFSPTPSENLVFFDDGNGAAARGTVLAASATELRVRVPNLPNPALRLRVAVTGAPDFSNEVAFPLTPAVVPFGDLDEGIGEDPKGVTSGPDGSLYVSLNVLGAPDGIVRFSADGARAPFSTQAALWTDFALADDGALIGARQIRGLFRLPEGTERSTFAAVPSGNSLRTVARDATGAIWTAGTNTVPENANLYRVATDGTVTSTPFGDPVVDLAVADGVLYVATATVASSVVVDSKVWTFPITAAGDLGAGTVLYDVTTDRGSGIGATSLAVAADGTVFVATNAADPVVEVAPGGAATVLYPGVIPGPIVALTWAPGSVLYAVRGLTAVEAEEGGVATLLTIETRRQGPF